MKKNSVKKGNIVFGAAYFKIYTNFALYLFAGLIMTATPLDSVAQESVTDTTILAAGPHPNTVPYSSERTFGQHLLALPSYLWDGVVYPLGAGIRFAEKNMPLLFKLLEGERIDYGFFPIIKSGGEEGFAGGMLFYHDKLFEANHRVRADILLGSREYNEFHLEYHIPFITEEDKLLSVIFDYQNDPVTSYYTGGLERLYTSEETLAQIEFRYPLSSVFSTLNTINYRNINIRDSDYEDDDFLEFPKELKGNTKLLTLGSRWVLDLHKGDKRVYRGAKYIAGMDIAYSLKDNTYSYLTYHLEWQQFLPLGFLPKSRRLGFRAKLDKAEQLGDDDIPFFDQPTLGSTEYLRGFDTGRFQDDGSLLLTLEYRYPMWDFIDVTIFVDEGQVFTNYDEIAINHFNTGYGFGFHFLSPMGIAFRTELAFSKETSRFIISLTPNF